MVGFEQKKEVLSLEFSEEIEEIYLQRYANVLSDIGKPTLNNFEHYNNVSGLNLKLIEGNQYSEYSIVLYLKRKRCSFFESSSCQKNKYIEIIRQPSNWLLSKFNFKKEDGYSILGRRNIAINAGSTVVEKFPKLLFNGIPKIDIKTKVPLELSGTFDKYPEINDSILLIKRIWSSPLRGGPSTLAYSDFLKLNFEDKLESLRAGKFSVMCSGMRDLFLHATLARPNLKARSVDAFSYWPHFPDLISYGHSVAEVWVNQLRKWVLIDPWLGVYIIDQNGNLQSAEDLLLKKKRMKAIIFIDKIRRFNTNSQGEVINVPTGGKGNLYSYSFSLEGHSPGYLEYFSTIFYKDFGIQ